MGILDWLGRSGAKAPKPKVVSVADAHSRAQAGDLTIIDVRMPEEWAATGMPKGAEGLTLGSSEFAARALRGDALP